MKLTTLFETIRIADSVKTLHEGSGSPLQDALRDLASLLNGSDVAWALAGGLSAGFYSRPRGTQDIDIILMDADLDKVVNLTGQSFRQISPHMIEHHSTGVVVDLITPQHVNRNPQIWKHALETVKTDWTVPVVSREALVALKLCRGEYIDKADIQRVLEKGGDVNLSDYEMTKEQLIMLDEIRQKVTS